MVDRSGSIRVDIPPEMQFTDIVTQEGTGEAHLAVLDILGAGAFFGEGSLEKFAVEFGMAFPLLTFLGTERPSSENLAEEYKPKGGCEYIHYADTVLVYNFDTSPEGLEDVIITTARLLSVYLGQGWPARCWVTSGSLIIPENLPIYGGRGLIRAHGKETIQGWAGGAIDPELEGNEEMEGIVDRLQNAGVLVRYDVPFEEDEARECLCLGWPIMTRIDREEMKDLLYNQPGAEKEGVREKIERTVQFFDHVLTDFSPAVD